MKGITSLYNDMILKPRLCDESDRRKSFACNVILLLAISLLLVLDIFCTYRFATDASQSNTDRVHPVIMYSMTSCLICLLYMSRKGFLRFASHALILMMVSGCLYAQMHWGIDLPSVILLWCFIITASSILISTSYALGLAAFISIDSITLLILQQHHVFAPVREWRHAAFVIKDAVGYSVMLILIAGVSWLSNSEIDRSLRKAKASEKMLREERDNLSKKVREKADEIQDMHAEKINDMYKLVEFGRISSGLFHDLIGPLGSLCLMVGEVGAKDVRHDKENKGIQHIQQQLQSAVRVSRKITAFIGHAKKQLQKDTDQVRFSAIEEIENVIALLDSKTRKCNVRVIFNPPKTIFILGSPTIFSHIVTNIISNAIDSYSQSISADKAVVIYIQQKKHSVRIQVKDFGSGIPEAIQGRIFDPFFTTKAAHGCGVGLSATKYSLEKYFGGTISFKTGAGKGTVFAICLPKIKNAEKQLISQDDNIQKQKDNETNL